jgi:hypothetical protein
MRQVTYNYNGIEYIVHDVQEGRNFIRLILKTLTGNSYLVISTKK